MCQQVANVEQVEVYALLASTIPYTCGRLLFVRALDNVFTLIVSYTDVGGDRSVSDVISMGDMNPFSVQERAASFACCECLTKYRIQNHTDLRLFVDYQTDTDANEWIAEGR